MDELFEAFDGFIKKFDGFIEKYVFLGKFLICAACVFAVIMWVILALFCVIWFFVILYKALIVGALQLLWLILWDVVVAVLITLAALVMGVD